jgi:mono/diheme cytochrome c family protein
MHDRRFSIRFALVALIPIALSCRSTDVPLPVVPEAMRGQLVTLRDRGEYVVRNAAVCGHCHAANPKEPDGPLSGGMEFENWRIGTARAANLTTDPETGLGRWSEAEIVRSIRNGVTRDGRLMAPVMPYAWFHGMSDRDAFAVATYLKTLPPVRNAVRQDPSFWFRVGKLLFLGPEPAVSITGPPRAVTAEYGEYLSQHVGLCADCHTPRSGLLQRPDRDRLFAGMNEPPAGFPVRPSNLTPDVETGIGRWSEEDFLRTLRTGVNPAGRELHPFMPWQQIRRMSDDDLRAIYRFLRSLPPIRNSVERDRQ